MFPLVLEKAEEPEFKLPASPGLSKKQESSRKTSISALLTMPKPLTVWITINCGKFWKRWEYQTTWPAFWETCMQGRKQQLELVWNNRLVPNRKKSTSRLYIITLLTYIQSTSCEMPGSVKHKLESRLLREISITSDMQITPPIWQKVKRNRTSWRKWNNGVKSWLKSQHSKNEDHGIWSHHFMTNRWGNNGNSDRLYFLGLKNHCGWWLQPWN